MNEKEIREIAGDFYPIYEKILEEASKISNESDDGWEDDENVKDIFIIGALLGYMRKGFDYLEETSMMMEYDMPVSKEVVNNLRLESSISYSALKILGRYLLRDKYTSIFEK